MPAVWCLNLDAEIELGTLGPYTRSERTARQIELAKPAARHVLGPQDVVLGESAVGPGWMGRAWCMTPRAREALTEANVTIVESPDVSVLCAVNDREFGWSVSRAISEPTLPGASYVTTEEGLLTVIAKPPIMGSGWLLKRAFSMAKKGQRPLSTVVGEQDARWLQRSVKLGGVLVEPFVEVICEFVVHGYIDRDRLFLSRPKMQRSPEIAPDEHRAPLERAAEAVGRALFNRGYFGPFGVDSFLYRGAFEGPLMLNTLSEVNARYTIGYQCALTGKPIALGPNLVQSG